MGVCVIVLGKSGSGKSRSIKGFKGEEVGVLNVIGKPLPFKNESGIYALNNPSYETIKEKIVSGTRKVWVVDDAGYLMQNENFARAKEKGYDKFTEMAFNFQQLVYTIMAKAPADCFVYLLMHPELDAIGNEKIKTIGKMLDEKYTIEGTCSILLDCELRDGKHVFVTNNHGLSKSPEGMLPEVMENDLYEVDRLAREYWGYEPLRNKEN